MASEPMRLGAVLHLGDSYKPVPLELPASVQLASTVFAALKDRDRTDSESLAYAAAAKCMAVFFTSSPLWAFSSDGVQLNGD